MPLTPGTKLGPYEVVAPLGAGGMGEVYRARDTRLNRDVAIKVLPQHLSADADVRARFEREAKAVAALNHPHICVLHDVGREGDTDYLVMELVEGETLSQRLTRGALPPSEVLRLGAQIADALDRAHRAGVVHRDLKPGNVMITKSGAKLMDFGLARATASAGPVSASGATMAALTQHPTVASPLTAAGTIVGTFQYMSPEHLEGLESDARADLWALGCVLYEMVTGKRAFEGTSQASLISAIMKDEPRSLLEVAPVSPPALDRVVRACLAKDAGERMQTAHDVKLQLQWISEAGSQGAVPAPLATRRRDRGRFGWVAALAVVVIGAVAAVLWFPRDAGRGPVVHASVLPPDGVTFSAGYASPIPIALSPDGSLIAFCARQGEGADMLWVRSIGADDARPIAGTEGAWGPFFSPDGRSLGFLSGATMKKVPVGGGPVTTLYKGDDFRGASWGPGGKILFSHPDGPVCMVDDEGGPATPVTRLDSLAGESTHRYPSFLPDGKHFLYLARRSGAGRGVEPGIYVGKLGSLERKRVLSVASNVVYASGHLLYVKEGVLMSQPFDTRRLQTTGPAVAIQSQLRWEERFSRGAFAASQTGLLAFMTGNASSGSQLKWLDRSGLSLGVVGEPTDYTYGGSPAISPDGRKAVIPVLNTARGNSDAFLVDLASGRSTRLTVDDGDHPAAVWSNDDSRIVVNGGNTPKNSLEFRTLGGTRVDTIGVAPVIMWPRATSPDGRHILFDIDAQDPLDPGTRLYAMPTAGGGPSVRIGPAKAVSGMGQFSPDGRYVAYQSDETGREEVYVVTFPEPGGRWQISQAGGGEVRWNRNGRELLYFDRDHRLQSVEVQLGPGGFQVGQTRPLFQFHGVGSPLRYDIHPDGQRFLVSAPPANEPSPSITIVSNWTAGARKR
ncbi:MAG: protein kinase [Candidatus Eisenbacteria bacterium]|uniref:non-specific serine/threonine protein kinase n=1 Tax=Eiseniibacteriota bacterium TaxID=2212470 RepID=A0A933W441_UNCEI|nr:protein kinase [Candidatus Eisenbacteria bacterium]